MNKRLFTATEQGSHPPSPPHETHFLCTKTHRIDENRNQRITEETHNVKPTYEPELSDQMAYRQQETIRIPEDVRRHPNLAPATRIKMGKNTPAIPGNTDIYGL